MSLADGDRRRREEKIARVRAYLVARFPGDAVVVFEDQSRLAWAFRVDPPIGGARTTLWIRRERLEDEEDRRIESEMDQQHIVEKMNAAGTNGVELYVSYLDPSKRGA